MSAIVWVSTDPSAAIADGSASSPLNDASAKLSGHDSLWEHLSSIIARDDGGRGPVVVHVVGGLYRANGTCLVSSRDVIFVPYGTAIIDDLVLGIPEYASDVSFTFATGRTGEFDLHKCAATMYNMGGKIRIKSKVPIAEVDCDGGRVIWEKWR